MKKAKIVLSAVALLAVVGGALAFKANRIPKTFYSGPACTTPVVLPYTTVNNGRPTLQTSVTTIEGAACPLTTLYFDN